MWSLLAEGRFYFEIGCLRHSYRNARYMRARQNNVGASLAVFFVVEAGLIAVQIQYILDSLEQKRDYLKASSCCCDWSAIVHGLSGK